MMGSERFVLAFMTPTCFSLHLLSHLADEMVMMMRLISQIINCLPPNTCTSSSSNQILTPVKIQEGEKLIKARQGS
jgi:hypothetical protein